MMGLQRQKALSTKQNEQLQREVEALQKQLAQLEELEGEMEQSSRQTGHFPCNNPFLSSNAYN